jgi:ubiquinone/menaquinone biosynthesis C-methylase UbiE
MQTLDHRRPGGVDPWEAAYLRFETPEQEVAKFRGRLQHIGATAWPRDWLILDLFCGRGGGGQALRRMGFEQIYGVDMSERLLREHRDRGSTAVGDCTRLPIASRIADVAIVQGGLHHLPRIPEDLSRTLDEVCRVLRPGGLFVMVEPWRTPFLDAVHLLSRARLARRMSKKIDALATMIEHEQVTYNQWLCAPQVILTSIAQRFRLTRREERWGKIYLTAVPNEPGSAA